MSGEPKDSGVAVILLKTSFATGTMEGAVPNERAV
jgi:hypothetical protein